MITAYTGWLNSIADELEVPNFQLGCSPAEQQGSPEVREINFVNHSGCPEMDLTQVYDLS